MLNFERKSVKTAPFVSSKKNIPRFKSWSEYLPTLMLWIVGVTNPNKSIMVFILNQIAIIFVRVFNKLKADPLLCFFLIEFIPIQPWSSNRPKNISSLIFGIILISYPKTALTFNFFDDHFENSLKSTKNIMNINLLA